MCRPRTGPALSSLCPARARPLWPQGTFSLSEAKQGKQCPRSFLLFEVTVSLTFLLPSLLCFYHHLPCSPINFSEREVFSRLSPQHATSCGSFLSAHPRQTPPLSFNEGQASWTVHADQREKTKSVSDSFPVFRDARQGLRKRRGFPGQSRPCATCQHARELPPGHQPGVWAARKARPPSSAREGSLPTPPSPCLPTSGEATRKDADLKSHLMIQTTVCRTDKQPGPTAQHREPPSTACNSLQRQRVWRV